MIWGHLIGHRHVWVCVRLKMGNSTSEYKYSVNWQRERHFKGKLAHTRFCIFCFASEDINAVKAHWLLICTQSPPVAWILYWTVHAHCATQTLCCVELWQVCTNMRQTAMFRLERVHLIWLSRMKRTIWRWGEHLWTHQGTPKKSHLVIQKTRTT